MHRIIEALILVTFITESMYSIDPCLIKPQAIVKGGYCFGRSCENGPPDPLGSIYFLGPNRAEIRGYAYIWPDLAATMDGSEIIISGKVKIKLNCSDCQDAPGHYFGCETSIPAPLRPYMCNLAEMRAHDCKLNLTEQSAYPTARCSQYCLKQCKIGHGQVYGSTGPFEYKIRVTIVTKDASGYTVNITGSQLNKPKNKLTYPFAFIKDNQPIGCPIKTK